jgi:Flp pilus assembly protein TadD
MLFRLARSELQLQDYEAATRLLRQFVALEAANAEGRYLLGAALNLSGDSAEALTQLRRAAELRPNWHQPYNDMAWILATHRDASIRDSREAIELAERAVGLAPRQEINLLDTLAAAYASAGRYESARDTINEALVALDPARDAREIELLTSRLDQYTAEKPLILPTDESIDGDPSRPLH